MAAISHTVLEDLPILSGWWLTYPSEKYEFVSFNPLWKIWVRQLGWWNSQLNGKSWKIPWFQSPPSSYPTFALVQFISQLCKYTSSMDGLVAGMGKTMEQQIWNPWKPRILTAVNPSIPASMSGTSTNILWMVAKSESPVDRCFIPLISHYLYGFNHPFGGPGFRNHPQYVEPRTNYQNNYAKHGQDSVLLISFNGCLGCLDAARKKKVFAWISDDIIDSYQIKYQPIVDQLFLYLYQH